MDIADVINPSRVSRRSRDYQTLFKKFNRYICKLNRHIFKYGWLYFLFFYLLYFVLAAYFSTAITIDINQAHVSKPTHVSKLTVCNVKATPLQFTFCFLKNFDELFTSQLPIGSVRQGSIVRLITGSEEIGFLALGAVFLLWLFRIWQANVPKTLRDLIKNNRISAHRGDTANRYLHFLDGYRRAFKGSTNYLLFIVIAILWAYVIYYVVSLFNIAIHLHPPKSPSNNPDFFLLNFLTLISFAIIKLMLTYSFCTILFEIFISGKYLRKLLHDFKIRKNIGNQARDPLEPLNLINFVVMLVFCVTALCTVIWAAVIPLWKI